MIFNDHEDELQIRTTIMNALSTYGIELQIEKFIEEMAECMVAIQHFKAHRVESEKVVEELADVYITLYQMIYSFDQTRVRAVIMSKVMRLKFRLAGT